MQNHLKNADYYILHCPNMFTNLHIFVTGQTISNLSPNLSSCNCSPGRNKQLLTDNTSAPTANQQKHRIEALNNIQPRMNIYSIFLGHASRMTETWYT